MVYRDRLGTNVRNTHITLAFWFIRHAEKQGEAPLFGLGPHSDTQPGELFGFVYLDDVPPKSGGTCIWPTSPQRLYSCFENEQSYGAKTKRKAFRRQLRMTHDHLSRQAQDK